MMAQPTMLLLTVAVAAIVLFTAQAALVALMGVLRPRGNVYVHIILVALATAPAVFFLDRVLVGQALTTEGRVFLVLVHLALGGFLFHFMTLPDRSVTLRIFVELDRTPGRSLSLTALADRYSVRAMIDSRLRQLADGRCLAIAPDGALTLLPRGDRFGRFVTGGRRLFRITSAN